MLPYGLSGGRLRFRKHASSCTPTACWILVQYMWARDCAPVLYLQ